MLPKALSFIKFPALVPFDFYTDAQLSELLLNCAVVKATMEEFKNDEVLLKLMRNIKEEQTRREGTTNNDQN